MARSVLLALVLAACAHGAAPDVTIGPLGAAGVTASTPMTRDDIARAAPGYALEEGETASGERRFARFTLSLDGDVVFNIYPSPDRSRPTGIGTRSALARGVNGEVIGTTTFAVSTGIDEPNCRLAMLHERFTFSCPDANGSFWRAYQVAEAYAGPRDAFEAIAPEARQSAVLAQMYWTPQVSQ